MGSWSVSCSISNIAITSEQKCVLLPLKENQSSETRLYQPACLPIFGQYDDYGGIENIEIDENTNHISEYFGITIDEFCEFLVDGKFTYNRDEVKSIIEKMIANDKFKYQEVENYRFMWIDRQVWDHMIFNYDNHNKGYLNFGTSTMLNLFGFTQLESPTISNYDVKRFNQLWENKDGIRFYSDGKTLLSEKNSYIYHIGKGTIHSLESYIKIPEELQYLKNITKYEAYKLMSKFEAQQLLAFILGSRYDYDDLLNSLDELMEKIKSTITSDDLEKMVISKPKKKTFLHTHYYDNLEIFGDSIVQLINVNNNLLSMSGQFTPHVCYLTPQGGKYEAHQQLLEKFAEINRSYITVYDEEKQD